MYKRARIEIFVSFQGYTEYILNCFYTSLQALVLNREMENYRYIIDSTLNFLSSQAEPQADPKTKKEDALKVNLKIPENILRSYQKQDENQRLWYRLKCSF